MIYHLFVKFVTESEKQPEDLHGKGFNKNKRTLGEGEGRVMKQTKTLYDFDYEFEELMDQAVNDLSPKQFAKFLDDISMILVDYEDGQEGE